MTNKKAYALAMILNRDDKKHGTITGYATYGCRCERCRLAKAKYEFQRPDTRVRNRYIHVAPGHMLDGPDVPLGASLLRELFACNAENHTSDCKCIDCAWLRAGRWNGKAWVLSMESEMHQRNKRISRVESREKMQNDPTDERHGKLNGYSNCQCRCAKCCAVYREYKHDLSLRENPKLLASSEDVGDAIFRLKLPHGSGVFRSSKEPKVKGSLSGMPFEKSAFDPEKARARAAGAL